MNFRNLRRHSVYIALNAVEAVETKYPLITPAMSVASIHTKHALEALHPNIAVFRHPDHVPDRRVLQSELWTSIQGMKLSAASASELPGDAIKAFYGMGEDTILFWVRQAVTEDIVQGLLKHA